MDVQERARKNEAAILNGLSRAGQVNVAAAMNVSESTISKLKGEELRKLARLLAGCGLKAVPAEMQCFDPNTLQAVVQLAKERMSQVDTLDQLAWEPN